MKRIIIIAMTLLVSVLTFGQTMEANTSRANIFAEEEPLVGEWSGLYPIYIYGDNFMQYDFEKLVILIKKYGDTFRIRAKFTDLHGSSVTYLPEAKVVFCDGQNISWIHYMGDNWNWTDGDRHKGRIIGHTSNKTICRASYKDGVILYHE